MSSKNKTDGLSKVNTLLLVIAVMLVVGLCVMAGKLQALQDTAIETRDECIIKAHQQGAKSYTLVDGVCYLEAK
jgi:hypothetical protein